MPDYAQQVETLRRRAEAAEAMLLAHAIEEVHKREHDAQAIREANERQRARERDEALQVEREQTRKASWLRYLTLPGENINRLAANEFSPTWIKDQTPDDADQWPPDDAPHNHQFYHSLEHSLLPDDAPGDAPPLVQQARKLGAVL